MTIENTTIPVTSSTEGAPDPYSEFAAVFDSLITPEGQQDDQPTPQQTNPSDHTAGAADDAQQQAQQADGGGDSGEPPAAGTDAPAGDGQGVQDGQGDNAAGSSPDGSDDLKAQLAALQQQLAALQAPAAPQPAPAPAPAPAAAPEPRSIYSPEEQTELAALQKEWPDLSRMFALMARQVQHETLTYAFSEMERVLTPIQSSVGTMVGNEHMAAIYEKHEDYDQVYQPVMEWIEKQPSFLKAAYQNVVKQGTADDVILMIQRFKDETKWQAPAAAPGGSRPAAPVATAPSQPKAELSDAAKKAATAIGAVGTKRSGPTAAKDPLDFDGAWEEATASK